MSDVNINEAIPLEILCYAFTFLNTKADIKAAVCVCQQWREAFTFDRIWKQGFYRFYGHVSKDLAKFVPNWHLLFRKRSVIDKYLRNLSRPSKMSTFSWKMSLTSCLLGGPHRGVLVFAGQPLIPRLIYLNNGQSKPFSDTIVDATATKFVTAANGQRLLVGYGTGLVQLFALKELGKDKDKSKEKSHDNTKNSNVDAKDLLGYFTYEKIMTFSDGHNHQHNMNRAIEQIVDNDKYVVSLAYNNTVAIWEKIPTALGDAHSYDLTTRRKMQKEIDEYDFYQFRLAQWEKDMVFFKERQAQAKAARAGRGRGVGNTPGTPVGPATRTPITSPTTVTTTATSGTPTSTGISTTTSATGAMGIPKPENANTTGTSTTGTGTPTPITTTTATGTANPTIATTTTTTGTATPTTGTATPTTVTTTTAAVTATRTPPAVARGSPTSVSARGTGRGARGAAQPAGRGRGRGRGQGPQEDDDPLTWAPPVKPQPRTTLIKEDVLNAYKISLKQGVNKSSLIKSILFKYPPSLIYLMPGKNLQVVVGMKNGKVLVWQSLSNYLLSGHTKQISHCVGFFAGNSGEDDGTNGYLVTFSSLAGELCLWFLGNQSQSIHVSRLLHKVNIELPFSKSVKHIYWQPLLNQLIICGDFVQMWHVQKTSSIDEEDGEIPPPESENEPQKPSQFIKGAEFGVFGKKVTCMRIEHQRSLMFIGFDDGSIMIYFLPTGQCVAVLAPTKSNQYFSLFDIQVDEFTLIACDDYCIHWKALAKTEKI